MSKLMKRSVCLPLVIIWLVSTLAFSGLMGSHGVEAGSAGQSPQYCLSGDFPLPPTSITSALATPPADVCGTPAQGNMDLFSWLSFIGLNWPASISTCGPDTGQSILSGTGPVVWETYLEDTDVFVAQGNPSGWCPQGAAARANLDKRLATLPPDLKRVAKQEGIRKFLIANSKAKLALIQNFPGINEAVGGVLTDQNGRFVRYEIHLNQDEYNYIIDPTNVKTPPNPFPKVNLWSKSGQRRFNADAHFPLGQISNQTGLNVRMGAVEIKAAWKVLGQGDDPSRFYTVKGIVYNDAKGAKSPGKNPVLLGLVGLHIMHRTTNQPKWLWSTFEHVDNAPLQGQVNPNTHYNFYNPKCANCPPDNTQTASPNNTIELDPHGRPINRPVQVARVNAIANPLASLNKTFQNLLKDSVWANYQLVSTQWTNEVTKPEPGFLANMTLETYVQGSKPPSDGPYPYPSPQYNPFKTYTTTSGQTFYPSSSCLKCHSVATQTLANKTAGFSFLLGEAQ
jgi:hypothetical protein